MSEEVKYPKGKHPNQLAALRPIKKGQVLNPNGARAHDPVKRAMRRFTNEYMKEIIELAVLGNLDGLQKIVKDKDAPAIQVGVARALFNAIKNGDWSTLNSIVERLIGKVPDRIDLSSDGSFRGITVTFVDAKKSE